ncbi:MAG: AraC family transcriptional regulator [Flavobacteriaceae bacterium]|nr:MAG: AraC family transcriptional regulator [Flavobacteriaceae bacterium]
MKLHQIDRSSTHTSSFTVRTNRYSHFLKIWHHHTELELVVVNKSTGTIFIGDGIEKFQEGDVLLIGKNLPHMWLNDDVYFEEDSKLVADALAIHFKEDFLGTIFQQASEMQHIHQLFQRAKLGVKFENLRPAVTEKIAALSHLNSFDRTVRLLQVLHDLAEIKGYRLLASNGFVTSFNASNDDRLSKIYSYVYRHFKTPIGAKDVAKMIHMNQAAFSRYFKRTHRKTFTRYLNEIRIGYACKLLIEQTFNIKAICYECGFNNISNFNRQFKLVLGISPSDYSKKHQIN